VRKTKRIAITLAITSIFAASQAKSFDLTEIAKQVAAKVAIDKTAETVSESISNGMPATQAGTSPVVQQELSSADPISSTALPVNLEVNRGTAQTLALRPTIALAGYNIGAYQTAKISGSTSREQGASVSMSLALEGVDAAMLQRIADASHADLVAQLQAAGIDVIDAPAFFRKAEAEEVIRSPNPVNGEQMDGRAPKELLVVGLSGVGVVSSFGLIPKGFNGNVGDQASAALNAIVVYPNVALDFAWTSGGGRSMLQRRVSVDAGARFALDSVSKFHVVHSKDGRFVDDSVTLGLSEDLGVDDVFATINKSDSTDNSGAVGLANALGFGMGSRKGSNYSVTVDKNRYEALAMNATKGFNAALVKQISIARNM